jgi:hypothetical protein
VLHPVLLLAASAERLIGAVYLALARAQPETEMARVFERLAAEEGQHAVTLERLVPHVPDNYPGYDYAAILANQAAFVDSCTRLLHEAHSGPHDLDAVLPLLVALEGSLSEKWLLHLKMLVGPELAPEIASMAAASSAHAATLKSYLPSEA